MEPTTNEAAHAVYLVQQATRAIEDAQRAVRDARDWQQEQVRAYTRLDDEGQANWANKERFGLHCLARSALAAAEDHLAQARQVLL